MSTTDFDFIFGSWNVGNHKRANVFDPSSGWQDFDAVSVAAPILGGLGNVDDITGPLPDGSILHGHTMRLLDPATDSWRIWWASNREPGVLDEPVEGSFTDGVGTFTGIQPTDSGDVLVRFRWLTADADHPVWEQDFSHDGGASWDPINWTMTLSRR